MDNKKEFKDIEIKGRSFRITKFDAMTGSFMVLKVIGILTPLFKNIKPEMIKNESGLDGLNFTEIFSGLTSLKEEDFRYIQTKCLNVCNESLGAGFTPVLNSNGTFGVLGLENDTVTVMTLTIHSLIFNVSGFFGESLLTSLSGGLSSIFPPNQQT